jgi:ornithine cyclodeaminase/alanine dehydrogenase-like protein (mu-crystallin family)
MCTNTGTRMGKGTRIDPLPPPSLHATRMTLLLSRADLEQLLDLDRVIKVVEAAFAAYADGKTVTPPRGTVSPPGTGGVLLSMPCALVEPPTLGTKVIAIFRGNAARGLPTATSLYLLSEYDTGAPLAVMDGTYLTAVRTAAGSAVATRYLARPDARTLGVFGTGVQARFHVDTIRRVRPIDRVLVAGTSAEKAADFARWVRETFGIEAVASSPADASEASIVAACTTSPVPVIVSERVRDGAHVNAVGAFTPLTRELPTALVARAGVYVDTRAGAFAEAGDFLIPVQEGAFSLDAVRGEIGELCLGRAPGRRDGGEITIYKSVGAAFLDAATAHLAYDQAVRRGAGQTFAFT